MPRFHNINGENVQYTEAEETARDAEEKAWVDAQTDYVANHKYKDDRVEVYPDIRDFADAYYWSQKGDDSKMTAYISACAKVKSDLPKPE